MSNPFLGVRAALFDLDGTLVKTHIDFPFMKREVVRLAAEYGRTEIDPAAVDILTFVEAVRSELIVNGRQADAAEYRRRAFNRLEEIEVEQCGAPELIPGATELTGLLAAAGVRVGVVTRNCRRVSEELLRFGRIKYEVLRTRDDVPVTKPNPDHLHRALDALKVCRAERAVMVGDHWMDVQAGKAAGLRTVGLLLDRPQDFFNPAQPDFLVDGLCELLPFVTDRKQSELAPRALHAVHAVPNA